MLLQEGGGGGEKGGARQGRWEVGQGPWIGLRWGEHRLQQP